jgi:dipeptidyl aminopeptidase/acylaminoacyl peptidase
MVPNDWRSRSLTLEAATGDPQRLAPALTFFIKPRFSPDGASLLVKGRKHRGNWGLHQVDLATGTVTATHLENAMFGNAEWVSATRVLYTLDGSLGDLDVATGRTRTLCSVAAAPLQVTGLAVSPSRDAAVVSLHDPASRAWRILRVALDDCRVSELVRATEPEGVVVETWWPAADALIVTRWTDAPNGKSTRERVGLLPASGGTLEDVGIEAAGVREVRLRPDGRRVAFTAGSPTWEIWKLEHVLPAPQEHRSSVRRASRCSCPRRGPAPPAQAALPRARAGE